MSFSAIKKVISMAFLIGMPFYMWPLQQYTSEQKTQAVPAIIITNQNERLLNAASRGDLRNVQASLERGANSNATDSAGNSALMRAIINVRPEVIDFLLNYPGVDINIKDATGNSAVVMAAFAGLSQVVATLLGKGADRQPLDDMKVKEKLRSFIQGRAMLVAPLESDEARRLRSAFYRTAYPQVLRVLHEYEGQLRSAIEQSVSLAYDWDAQEKEKEQKEREQKTHSAVGGQSEVVTSLIQGYCGVPESSKVIKFLDAARKGDAAQVKSLLEEGIDPNVRDAKGVTALMYALANIPDDSHSAVSTTYEQQKYARYYDVVKLLFDYGANIADKDTQGNSAFSYVLQAKSPEEVSLDQQDQIRKRIFSVLFGQTERDPRTLEWRTTRGRDLNGQELEETALFSKQNQDFVERMRIAQLLLSAQDFKLPADEILLSKAIGFHDWYMFKALLAAGAYDPQDLTTDRVIVMDDPQFFRELTRTYKQELLDKDKKLAWRNIARLGNKNHMLEFFTRLDQDLIAAAINNDTAAVYDALNRGAYPDAIDIVFGNATPLMYAAGNGNSQIILALLRFKADINLPNENGISPLMWAALMHKPEAVKLLLDQGANPDSTDNTGRTFFAIAQTYPHNSPVRKAAEQLTACRALLLAAAQGDENRVKELLVQDRSLVNCHYQDSYPLAAAIWGGNLGIVSELLQAGADPIGKKGLSNLSRAILKENVAIVNALLQAGADPFVTEITDITPEDYVRASNNRDTISLIEQYHRWRVAFFKALLDRNQKQAFELFNQSPVFVNARDQHGRTPLRLALDNQLWDIAHTLYTYGANINENFNEKEITPLMQAANQGNEQAVEFLLGHKAAIDAKDHRGLTALAYAAKADRSNIVQLLLDAGTDLSLRDYTGHDVLEDVHNPALVKLITDTRTAREHHAKYAAELKRTVDLMRLKEQLDQEEYEMSDLSQAGPVTSPSKRQRKE